MTHRSVDVPVVARVEGEGALHLRIEDDELTLVELEIYEPPRFFEAFLRGRQAMEVSDIVPRICGICPVAYQMSAIYGLEELFEVEVPAGTHELRRMLYLGEWIESHMLHVHLLALPDYLGFDDAIQLAKAGYRHEVERGLGLKRLGNDIMGAIGGREIHPVSPRLGGFSKAVDPKVMRGFLPRLDAAAEQILEVADLVASIEKPTLQRDAELVAMVHPDRYAICEGSMASTRGRAWTFAEYEDVSHEIHVAHSNALHSVFADTETPYFLGPLARVMLNAGPSRPAGARGDAPQPGSSCPTLDPFASMAARVVEVALAIEECQAIVAGYEPPDPPRVEVTPRAGRAHVGDRGAARHAVPPLRRGRRRRDHRGEDRAADLAEPAPHGTRPVAVPAGHARPARRRAHPSRRDGGAQLRPVHQLRDPLPAARRGRV